MDDQWCDLYGGSVGSFDIPAMPNYVIACNGIATDDQGATDMGTVSVLVENRPPELGAVTITPSSNIYLDDVLTCEAPVSIPMASFDSHLCVACQRISSGGG